MSRLHSGLSRLDQLKASNIDALFLSMRARTKPVKDGEPVRALSDSTIRNVYLVLRSALDGAVPDGLVACNVATQVDHPPVARKEAKHSSAADVTKLLEAAAGLRYQPALVLVATTGMRRGEALALSWQSVNFEAGTLRVEGTLGRVGRELLITEPKTERSRHTVPLSPAMVALLKA